jgi:guanidinoacetate N-methyltransferase
MQYQKDGAGYHGLHQGKKDWENMDAVISKDEVVIDGHPVMESWEQPYMNKLASIAAGNGGIVLEVGFGLGLSGHAIQKWNIKEHIIIEANKDVYKSLMQFAAKEAQEGRPRVTPLFGLWEDVVATLPDNLVDGILYDTYPQSREEQHIHQFGFIQEARRILKPSGILTYCNLTSLGVLGCIYGCDKQEKHWQKLIDETQLPHIAKAGFMLDRYELFQVNPPPSCKYYSLPKAFCPYLRKASSNM